jgi:hypothetical protein
MNGILGAVRPAQPKKDKTFSLTFRSRLWSSGHARCDLEPTGKVVSPAGWSNQLEQIIGGINGQYVR